MQLESSSVAAIHRAEVAALILPLIETGIPAGFSPPADDYHPIKIDLNKDLVRNPIATFFVRVCDDSMNEENIYDGDILLVDRAEERVSGDIIVAQAASTGCASESRHSPFR
jgi:DNA polymerase V